MSRSLKEQRQARLVERIVAADKQLLQEERVASMLLEAMNQEDLNKVDAIVQKLNSIKSPQLPKLTAAIEKAQAEINKYTAGGPLTKAWTKVKGAVGIDNPIVKVMTFANALERGFSQIPTILRNNGIDLKNVDLSKSLAALLAKPQATGDRAKPDVLGSTELNPPPEAAPATSQNEADSQVEGKLKTVLTQLQKALSPGGIYGVFRKVPYINSQELAQELIQAPVNVFAQVAKKIQSGAKAADVAADLKGQIAGQGEEQTAHSGKEDPTKPSQQTQPTVPGKPTVATTGTASTGEHPTGTGQRGGGAPQSQDAKKAVFSRLKDAGVFKKVGLNDASAEALLKVLDDIGSLKSPE
jgi:hypothetical protein